MRYAEGLEIAVRASGKYRLLCNHRLAIENAESEVGERCPDEAQFSESGRRMVDGAACVVSHAGAATEHNLLLLLELSIP